MSREREKILQMVADGTITPEEAEKLLSRLESAGSTSALEESKEGAGNHKSGKIKFLCIVVDGKDKVNVRVPVGLIRTGIKLSTLMPRSATERLSERGIDLSQLKDLDGEELMDALRELALEVDSDNGDVVRVFCE